MSAAPIDFKAPAERPRCLGCEQLLRPDYIAVWKSDGTRTFETWSEKEEREARGDSIVRRFRGWKGEGGIFHSQACAAWWAVRTVRKAREQGVR